MEVKEYVREIVRMFNSLRTEYKDFPSCEGVSCENCPMVNTTLGCICYSEEAVDIVEKWSKEHPIKTIMMDLLEKYPNAEIGIGGTPKACPKHLGYKVECNCKCCKCWNTPLEEVE